ncbi:hypothetical protein [Actinomyces ruminicola]|uniref:hypothetical protein n=1 Tax=Actinomyces ruminicola TaxID=332524 RepID=UPI0011CA3043|nr:hypothetical protein [Actinomyces ruminicola]
MGIDSKVRQGLLAGLCVTLRTVMLLVGLALLLWGAQWAAMASGLSVVRPNMVADSGMVTRIMKGDGTFSFVWWRSTLEAALGFALIPKWRAKGRYDVVAVAVVVVSAVCMAFLVLLMAGAGTYGTCTYPGCWPNPWDLNALAAPFFAGLATLAVMACFADRIPLWVRCLSPTAVYLIGTVLLVLVWDRWLLPFFAGPPPW